jgi:hypothetical protein
MTKKHFEEVARILRTTEMPGTLRAVLALEFSRVFEQQNPRFNRSRFFTAATKEKK